MSSDPSSSLPQTTGNVPAPDLGQALQRSFDVHLQDIGTWLLIGLLGTFAFGVGFWGGFQNCALKAARGQKVEIGDVLMPFSRPIDFLVPVLIIFGLSLLCVVPGIVASVFWFYMYPVMIDQEVGWREAMTVSKRATDGSLLMVFLLLVVGGLISGALSFLTAPFAGLIPVMAYLQTFYPADRPQASTTATGGSGSLPGRSVQPAPSTGAGSTPAGPAAQVSPAAPRPSKESGDGSAHILSSEVHQPKEAEEEVETATQSTTDNPDEIVRGKTMAMNAMDFEEFLRDQSDESKSD